MSEAGTLTTHRDKEGGRSNLFSVDDISIIVISFFPHRNRADLDRNERICLAVRKMNRRKGGKKVKTG